MRGGEIEHEEQNKQTEWIGGAGGKFMASTLQRGIICQSTLSVKGFWIIS